MLNFRYSHKRVLKYIMIRTSTVVERAERLGDASRRYIRPCTKLQAQILCKRHFQGGHMKFHWICIYYWQTIAQCPFSPQITSINDSSIPDPRSQIPDPMPMMRPRQMKASIAHKHPTPFPNDAPDSQCYPNNQLKPYRSRSPHRS